MNHPVNTVAAVITTSHLVGTVLTATLPENTVGTLQFTRTDAAGTKTAIAGAAGQGVNTLSYTTAADDLSFKIGCDASALVVASDGISLSLPGTGTDIPIPVFSVVVGDETWTTPVQDYGPAVLVDGYRFDKIVSGDGDAVVVFNYLLDKPIVVKADNIDVTGLNNANNQEHQVGSLRLPGDALYQTAGALLTVVVTADSPLPACELSVNWSTVRSNPGYRARKAYAGGANTLTMEIAVSAYAPSVIKLAQVQQATAPTTLPSMSGLVDANTLANVEWPLYFSFDSGVTPANCNITSIVASVALTPPASDVIVPGVAYRDARLQPFESSDHWNMPMYDNAVISVPVATGDPTSSGDQTTGTLNAYGQAGSNIVQVTSTAGVKPGMIPCFAFLTPSSTQYGVVGLDMNVGDTSNKSTADAFGFGNFVASVIDATHVQMNAPLIADINLRGIYYYNAIPCLAFADAETVSVRIWANGGEFYQPGSMTGLYKAVNYSAHPVASKIPVLQASADDAVQHWTLAGINTPNGWLHAQPAQYAAPYGEVYNNLPYAMRTPGSPILSTTDTIRDVNGDGNLVIVTADGRYSVESFMAARNTDGSYAAYRSLSLDLHGQSIPYFLNRPENRISGYSQGTRAYGGSLAGGVVRLHELNAIPSSANQSETPAEIAAAIEACRTAIPHRLAMIFSANQIKSPNYAADPGNQNVLTDFFMYVSQYEEHTPSIKAPGAGYTPGELLTVTGGSGIAPMRVKVEEVDGDGGVTKVFVAATGQYKSLAGLDAGNLVSSSSGAGTGCVLNALALADTSVTTTEQAFPTADQTPIYAFPATCADSGFLTSYAGCAPMGSVFAVPRDLDLAAIWTDLRTNLVTRPFASYDALAILFAFQRYGGVLVDTAYLACNTVVLDSQVPTDQMDRIYANMGLITGYLSYVQNYSPSGAGSGAGGNLLAPMAAPLYPLNNGALTQ